MKSNPYDKREDKNAKKAFAKTKAGVKPVAKSKNPKGKKMSKGMKKDC